MDMVNFDSLAYSKRLAAHGFTTEQADALAEEQTNLINSQLSTKSDIALVRKDMKEIEATLRRDMKAIETTLRRDMKAIETTLRRDMKELEMRITIKLGGLMVTSVALVTAIIKLL